MILIVARLLTINALTGLVYFLLFAAQSTAMNESYYWASLVFLPHGWRLVSFFLFRFSAIPGLFLGHLATCLYFFGQGSENFWLYVATSVVSAGALPMFYLLVKASGTDLLAPRDEYPVVPWTFFAMLGLAGTLLNGTLVAMANAWYHVAPINWEQVGQYLVGDFVGAVLFVGGLIAFFRWQRHRMTGLAR